MENFLMSQKGFYRDLISLSLVLAILYLGKVLFIPLFFACFVSFIAYPICKWFERKKINYSLSILLAILIVLLPVIGILFLLAGQIIQISHQWPDISIKLIALFETINLPDQYKISIEEKQEWLHNLIMNTTGSIYSGIISSAITLVQVIIIPFYIALILYHRGRLVYFLHFVFPGMQPDRLRSILVNTITAYYNFVKGMIVVYLTVGLLNSLGLYFLGIPNAWAFGFVASILTFIPYIGIMIGAILPITIAWGMYESVYYPLGVIAIFAFVQILEANVIYPLAVSHRIKVNTLITIIAIFTGGIIWDAAGMILFIPFLAILKLIADKVESLKPLRVLLETGSAWKQEEQEAKDEKNH